MLRALIFALAVVMGATGGATAQTQGPREGAEFIAGRWNFVGQYEDSTEGVGFWTAFNADGTCVDRDNYPCRWIISGSSFTMYYPDESELGYVGTISGREINGRFLGKHAAGVFTMTRPN